MSKSSGAPLGYATSQVSSKMPDQKDSGPITSGVPNGAPDDIVVDNRNPSGRDDRPQHKRSPKGRSRRSRKKRAPVYAALDLGTNNCRLLIAKPIRDSFKVIDSYSKVVRLGEGLAATGRLAEANVELAVEAIKAAKQKMTDKRVSRWRCVATQACRQAENGEEFLQRVKDETGISLEVISPRVEARLSVMGCLNLIDTQKDIVLVVDIGGGSTEISWVDARKLRDTGRLERVHRPPISAWASLPVGVVTLSEQVPETEDREAWYNELKNIVRSHVKATGADMRFTKTFISGRGHIIGTSGTITSLASIYLDLPYYQRDRVDGLWLNSSNALKVARNMAAITPEERAAIPSIGRDRSTMLVAGCAIVDVLCEYWPCERMRVADRGLREGILLGLMGQSQVVKTSNSGGSSS